MRFEQSLQALVSLCEMMPFQSKNHQRAASALYWCVCVRLYERAVYRSLVSKAQQLESG